jgi:hypothetical protein
MELEHMHRVVLGMDERVLDVGDSFSQLHGHVELWLLAHVGSKHASWNLMVDTKDPNTGYVLYFENESHAVQFKLTWL